MKVSLAFENSLEKVARIVARQFHINVVFEGNEAKTDGKTIFLPYFKDMTPALAEKLNGFLDHEVGHCKYTEFAPYQVLKNRFLRELVNATEDIRIERLIVEEFPGCQYHIDPLRAELDSDHISQWDGISIISKLLINIQWMMAGKEIKSEKSTSRYLKVMAKFVPELNSDESTSEIIATCQKILKAIADEREQEKEEEKEEDKSGEGMGKAGKGKTSDETKEGESFDKMMGEAVGEKIEGGSEFDKHSTDIEKFINKELKDHIKEESKKSSSEKTSGTFTGDKSAVSIPVTTRFDKVTNHSSKGDASEYNRLKRDVSKLVAPIKNQLERVLKVKENARWQNEKEQGKIDSRCLSKISVDKTYRTIFKQFTKTQTNNVAVELLVDMSGSMSGKMHTAKLATIAIAEALKALDIPFEVTGFYSASDSKVREFASSVKDKERFNRTGERLELHVFKDFNCHNLSGIEKLFVGSENPDGECVKWAATRLAMRKEKRKILIVLSDGAPSTGDSSSSILRSDLKNRVAKIEKSGIETVGIGIQTDAVKSFYKNFVVISDIQNLPTEAMKKLSSIIAKN